MVSDSGFSGLGGEVSTERCTQPAGKGGPRAG